MKLPRRKFLHLAAGTAALPVMARSARAQVYPSRPVRLIVGLPPGGQIDIIARLIGQWLAERLGQPFIIDNRPGAGSNIGAEAVVRAPADGYTLFVASTTNAINATLFDKLPYDFIHDTAPVASINRIPLVLEVNLSFPAKTVADLIGYAKVHPGKVNIASPSKGTGPYMAAQLFKIMAGVDIVHIPYRGSPPMLTDLLGGQIQAAFDGMSSSIEHIRAGKIRALAVGTATQVEALPGVPPLADFLPGYEASGWCGVVAPKNTPTETIEKLHKEINAGLANPKIKSRFADLGVTVLEGSTAEFGKLIADETEKWGKVIRAANIKPD
jgi:tripartite-type tricarboxylate transporter receptor subunit TctC